MIKQHKRYQSTYKDIKVKSVINLTIIFSFAIATKSHLHSPGAPLRILGPLDNIFTRALLRSGGGGMWIPLGRNRDCVPS